MAAVALSPWAGRAYQGLRDGTAPAEAGGGPPAATVPWQAVGPPAATVPWQAVGPPAATVPWQAVGPPATTVPQASRQASQQLADEVEPRLAELERRLAELQATAKPARLQSMGHIPTLEVEDSGLLPTEKGKFNCPPDLFFTWFVQTDGGRRGLRTGVGILRAGILCLVVQLAVLYIVWVHSSIELMGMMKWAPTRFQAYIDSCNVTEEEWAAYRVAPLWSNAVLLRHADPLFRTYNGHLKGHEALVNNFRSLTWELDVRPTAIVGVAGRIHSVQTLLHNLSADTLRMPCENATHYRLHVTCENGAEHCFSHALVQCVGMVLMGYYALVHYSRFFIAAHLVRIRRLKGQRRFLALTYAAAWYLLLPMGAVIETWITILDSATPLLVLQNSVALLFLLDIGSSVQSFLFGKSTKHHLAVTMGLAELNLLEAATDSFSFMSLVLLSTAIFALAALWWCFPEVLGYLDELSNRTSKVNFTILLLIIFVLILLFSTLLTYRGLHRRGRSFSRLILAETEDVDARSANFEDAGGGESSDSDR